MFPGQSESDGYVRSLLPIDRFHDLLKTLDTCFKVFDDLFSKHIRVGEVVQICQAFDSKAMVLNLE